MMASEWPVPWAVDEVHGLVHAGYHLDGQDVVAVLGVPVALRGGLCPSAQDGPGRRAAPQLHLLGSAAAARASCAGSPPPRPVHQHALGGVAHRGAGALGVVEDPGRHVQVGLVVDIDVAHAHAGPDDRHAGVLHHGADQPRPAPGDQHVHILRQVHQLRGGLLAGILHQGDAVLRQAGLCPGRPA